jgi:hypothetical protein
MGALGHPPTARKWEFLVIGRLERADNILGPVEPESQSTLGDLPRIQQVVVIWLSGQRNLNNPFTVIGDPHLEGSGRIAFDVVSLGERHQHFH